MTKLNALKKKFLERPDVRAEYDSLAEEFSIVEALIRARAEADMTQEQRQPFDEGIATLCGGNGSQVEDQP